MWLPPKPPIKESSVLAKLKKSWNRIVASYLRACAGTLTTAVALGSLSDLSDARTVLVALGAAAIPALIRALEATASVLEGEDAS
jgi:hypothetical protein